MSPQRLMTVAVALLFSASALGAAELPPLGTPAVGWAASLGHGAVATAEKRDGQWTFALAGEAFPAGHAKVPAEKVIFEIGSISKVFTGILLAKAVQEEKLGLGDTLAQRLPVNFASATTGAVTLRQLATHSSCLPRLPDNLGQDGADPYAGYDKKALFDYLAGARLEGTPPCTAAYSNLGFGTLGVVLETVYGKPWADLVREKITGPLGMTDTVQTLSKDQETRLAVPWDGAAPGHSWTFQAMAGAGALRSTLSDMALLADAFLLGAKGPLGGAWPLLAGDYADMPALGGKVGLALLHSPMSGEDAYLHDGGTGGYRSFIVVWPAPGRAAVVLASNAQANPGAWLASWQEAAKPAEPVSEISLPPAALDEYVGVYAIDKTARFTLLRNGDTLMSRLTGQPFIPVFASAKDEFFYKVVNARLSFHRDAAGHIDRVTLHQNGHDVPALREAGPAPRIEFPETATLVPYAGEYNFGAFVPGAKISVRATPVGLLVTLTGQPELPVFKTGPDRFEYDVVVATLTFERDAEGKVVAVVLHQNGLDMRAPKL